MYNQESYNQDIALDKSEDKSFAEELFIEIQISNLNVPKDVTLLDLPGFTNATKDDEETVYRIVEKYIKAEAAIILHVCKSDQDYDTILGNDFLRNIENNKILVLTHTDVLNNYESTNYKARIESTIKKTKDEKRFAVLGNHQRNFEYEIAKLKKQVCISNYKDIQKGTQELNQYIEYTIETHLDYQIPNKNLMYEELYSLNKRLDEINEEDSITLMIKC